MCAVKGVLKMILNPIPCLRKVSAVLEMSGLSVKKLEESILMKKIFLKETRENFFFKSSDGHLL